MPSSGSALHSFSSDPKSCSPSDSLLPSSPDELLLVLLLHSPGCLPLPSSPSDALLQEERERARENTGQQLKQHGIYS